MLFFQAFQILSFARVNFEGSADAVFVLGAAAYGKNPSPVFRERINHAMNIYRAKHCRYILLTGGKKFAEDFGEAVVARDYLIKNGIPAGDILLENTSNNTYENFLFSLPVISSRNISSIIIVSDPYHMKRASMIADDFGIINYSSPTPTSMFNSFKRKMPFLLSEIYNIYEYRIFRVANDLKIKYEIK
ncbi:MAG TPA: YdcF family protein [Spirochaetota bacterium]|nr:YdcF family protein [Spirochaetota bacterium]HOR43614.1 YdcF family protein [Spirochaetota bacterium]